MRDCVNAFSTQSQMKRASLNEIWSKEGVQGIEAYLTELDKRLAYGHNHRKHPYAEIYISEMDCMYDCIEGMYEMFYEGDGDCRYTRWDLEWYWILHQCDEYSKLFRVYIKNLHPTKKVDILYYSDHFVCYDREEKLVYDLMYDLSNVKQKSEYIEVDKILCDKHFMEISDEVLESDPDLDLYSLVS